MIWNFLARGPRRKFSFLGTNVTNIARLHLGLSNSSKAKTCVAVFSMTCR